MAHRAEPMDIDSSVCEFDNKENSFHQSNVLLRSPCTEKGYEELDVSELNMKLRYSITPASSPMSKSCTVNCLDNRNLESSHDHLTNSENGNLTRSLNSVIAKCDSLVKSPRVLPLQVLPSDQFVDGNRHALRPLDSTVTLGSVSVTVSGTEEIDDNISLPSSSSSMPHTPEATTPTKEIQKSDVGSPILRGLKSVFNMFRPSQSPIEAAEDINTNKPDALSPPVVNSPEIADSRQQTVLASTPLAAHKSKDSLPKRNSPTRDSMVFNNDLEKELQWKDESTIIFSKEKIPIHKLFFQQTKPLENIVDNKNITDRVLDVDEKLDSTVEYMDISYNDSFVNKTVTDDIPNRIEANVAIESDSEFLDCESFIKNESEQNRINVSQSQGDVKYETIESNYIQKDEEVLTLGVTKESLNATLSVKSSESFNISTETVNPTVESLGLDIVPDPLKAKDVMSLDEFDVKVIEHNSEHVCETSVLPENLPNPVDNLSYTKPADRKSIDTAGNLTSLVCDNDVKSNLAVTGEFVEDDVFQTCAKENIPTLENLGVNSISQIPLIIDPRILLFNIPQAPFDVQQDEENMAALNTTPADIPLPDDDDIGKGISPQKNDKTVHAALLTQVSDTNGESTGLDQAAIEINESKSTKIVTAIGNNFIPEGKDTLQDDEFNYQVIVQSSIQSNEIQTQLVNENENEEIIQTMNTEQKNTDGNKNDTQSVPDLDHINGNSSINIDSHLTSSTLVSENEVISFKEKATELSNCDYNLVTGHIVFESVQGRESEDDPSLTCANANIIDNLCPLVNYIQSQEAVRNTADLAENVCTRDDRSDSTENFVMRNEEYTGMVENDHTVENSEASTINLPKEKKCIILEEKDVNSIEAMDLIHCANFNPTTSGDDPETIHTNKLNAESLEINQSNNILNESSAIVNDLNIVHGSPVSDDTITEDTKQILSANNLSNKEVSNSVIIATNVETRTDVDDRKLEETSVKRHNMFSNNLSDVTPEAEAIDEEIAASENNSPFVSVTADLEVTPDAKPIDHLEKIKDPLASKTSIGIPPPGSPKIISKGYNFNFDEIDDPFATKTKIRTSPPPESNPNHSFEQADTHIGNVQSLAIKDICKNRRKTQYDKNKRNPSKNKFNSTIDANFKIDIKTSKAEAIEPSSTRKDKDIDFTTIKNVIDNSSSSTMITEHSKQDDDDINSSIHKINVDILSEDVPKEISTNIIKSDCFQKSTEIIIEESNVSSDECVNVKFDATKITSSLEHFTNNSAVVSPNDDINVKNVFNLPEIDDMNFNPFATKSKMRQSPPPFCSLKTSEVDASVSADTTINFDTQPAVGHSCESKLDTGLEEKDSSENLSNTTCSSKATDDKDVTVREVHTEDEDTIEGPFLEVEDLNDDKMLEFEGDNVDMMQFTDLPQVNDENMEAGELFIDAAAFEFLINQNKASVVADSGKESLFLKFDPLFAKRMSSDGVVAALGKVQNRQSTPKKLTKPHRDTTFVKSPIAGPSTLNVTREMDISNAFEESSEDFNITVTKPMMVVTPAVNPVVTSRTKSITPPRANRRSLTFTSPAIAVIDRLLSLSANNSFADHDTTVAEVVREQNEADLALTQLRELLADKEINVYNLRSESKELKERLATLESQVKSLESISEERLKKINELNGKLSEKTKVNKGMAAVVEEYERTIASLIAETEQDKKRHADERIQLIKERDEQTAHLTSMEVSFSDLHSKYEKSKQVILGFKSNEDTYRKSVKDFEDNLAKMHTNYELLKQHATSKLNHANDELQKMNRAHEAEVLKLNAMIKRKELHITSLEETLSQKTKANEELAAICDDLISKVG